MSHWIHRGKDLAKLRKDGENKMSRIHMAEIGVILRQAFKGNLTKLLLWMHTLITLVTYSHQRYAIYAT